MLNDFCLCHLTYFQNQFGIEPDADKKKVFLSGVTQRLRDFKSKLVSGWITKTRKRTVKEGNKMPWELYGSQINIDM